MLVVLVGALLTGGCETDVEEVVVEEITPELSVTPVDISTVRRIIEFGAALGPGRFSPAFEYYCNSPSVLVRSCCAGTVLWIRLNSNFPDYEMAVRVSDEWLVIYDHVSNLAVVEGTVVAPGDMLGTVGAKNRTELQMNRTVGGTTLSYCPFDYATADFVQQHKAHTDTWCLTDTVVP